MKRSRTLIGALAISAALVLVTAGCGSSGGSDASSDGGGGGTTTAASPSGGEGSDTPVALEGKVNDEGTKDISGDGDSPELEIELDDFYFSPTFVKTAPGATVQVSLSNEGDKPHTFTLDDGSVTQELAPGEEASVTVTVPESGSLRFACDFHGSMGMQGAFFYTDATGASGAGASGGDATTTTAAASDDGGSSGY